MMAGHGASTLLVAMIVGIFAIMAVAAVLVHPLRRQMMALGEEIKAYEGLSKYERDGLEMMLATSTSFFSGFIMLLSPLVVLFQFLAGAPEMSPVMRQVPKAKMAQLTKLSFISMFAANPFLGAIWLPLYTAIFGILALSESNLRLSPFGGFYRVGGKATHC